MIFQLNILPLIWSRDGPLFFSSLFIGIQFQSQLIVRRYPTSMCQMNIKKGCSKCGAKRLIENNFYFSHWYGFPRVHWPKWIWRDLNNSFTFLVVCVQTSSCFDLPRLLKLKNLVVGWLQWLVLFRFFSHTQQYVKLFLGFWFTKNI